MDYDTVIVRYAEIFLKSDYVRRSFSNRLADNLRDALRRQGIDGKVVLGHHRLFIKAGQGEKAAQTTSNVFGVKSASPAVRASPDFDRLTESAMAFAGERVRDGSFAVKAKRSKDYPLDSRQMECKLGAAIVGRYGNRVDLDNPETLISVEAYADRAYLFSETFPGVGGLPYGTQGKVACQADDRLQALAAWMMMRRGCKIVLAGGASDYAAALAGYCSPQPTAYPTLAQALEDGEVKGIVSAQTLKDIDLESEKKQGLPVFRPLIGLDESQIGSLLARAGL